MKKLILYIVLAFLLISSANAEKYFVLDVNHILGSVTFNSISLRELDRAIEYTAASGFIVKSVSFEDTDIETLYYNLSENKNYLVYVPYNENAARIEVYNEKNSKIMDIDVSSYSNTCGNSLCEEHESYESCTSDCSSGSKDDFCDGIRDRICDPDCPSNADSDCTSKAEELNETGAAPIAKPKEQKKIDFAEEEPEERSSYLLWILPIFVIAVFILLYVFVKKRKEAILVSSLKPYVSNSILKGFSVQQIKNALYRAGYNQKEVEKAIKSILP